jgi:hypothetical protein
MQLLLDSDRESVFTLGALQVVTKRCRPSWLTNSALVYEPNGGGGGSVVGSQPMSTALHNAHVAQISFVDVTRYLTYGAPITRRSNDKLLDP